MSSLFKLSNLATMISVKVKRSAGFRKGRQLFDMYTASADRAVQLLRETDNKYAFLLWKKHELISREEVIAFILFVSMSSCIQGLLVCG